jgi:hypothetical protein
MPKRLNFYTSLLIKHSLNWTEMREEKCLVVNSRSTEARLTGLRGGGGGFIGSSELRIFTTVSLLRMRRLGKTFSNAVSGI